MITTHTFEAHIEVEDMAISKTIEIQSRLKPNCMINMKSIILHCSLSVIGMEKQHN